mmetsp:Transcript_13231/g.26053  ORF Transcript_13231/g.26053 Transcript_13231/m.26053 type:complete len:310 (-) Transcript_13231:88-1017(-)
MELSKVIMSGGFNGLASQKGFLSETKRSSLTTDTADRADLDRVRTALQIGDVKTINDLRERNRANLKIQIDHTTGEFPIHLAAAATRDARHRKDVIDCLLWLLDDISVDIEACDNLGRTVLHVAANACDDTAVSLLLLARGADPLAVSRSSDLPSDFAKLQTHRKVTALLNEASKARDPIAWAHAHPLMLPELVPRLVPRAHHLAFNSDPLTTMAISKPTVGESICKPNLGNGSPPAFNIATYLSDSLHSRSENVHWKPPPHLRVVRRAEEANRQDAADCERKARSEYFIETLKRKTGALQSTPIPSGP